MHNPDTPSRRYQALLELLRASEALWQASRVFFSRWDISASQFNVLNLLSAAPDGVGQTELSRQLVMHRSNITGLVDRLEARGLVRRRSIENDRRAHRVVLTPRGVALVQAILPLYHQAAEEVWNDIPAASIESLLDQLAKLQTNINAMIPSLSSHENQS
jgi:DNA-binding MarR family transcriptional regulator